jgi:single-strand DNA-binding protein
VNVKSGRKSKLLNINQVFLSGNVVADAELRYTKTGKPVLTFRMATNKYVNEVQSTSYHNIVCWVDAEVYSGLRKGDFVAVAGELRSRSYEDKKGEKRYVTEVVAQNLTYGLKQNESQSNFDGYGEEEEKIPF